MCVCVCVCACVRAVCVCVRARADGECNQTTLMQAKPCVQPLFSVATVCHEISNHTKITATSSCTTGVRADRSSACIQTARAGKQEAHVRRASCVSEGQTPADERRPLSHSRVFNLPRGSVSFTVSYHLRDADKDPNPRNLEFVKWRVQLPSGPLIKKRKKKEKASA